jgi:ABC-2 type transport system ATP-binding protein
MSTTATFMAERAHRLGDGGQRLVEVADLVHRFGATRAIDGVSFDVAVGEIFGLLGPNGAGKTTTMRVLLTLLPLQAGIARVAGLDVRAHREQVRSVVGWVPQDRAIDPLLTGRENLRFVGGLHHLSRTEARRRADELLDLVGLSDAGDRLVRELSGGMRRRLELAMGLVHRPRLLLLDEPSVGLDVRARRRVWDHIEQIRSYGTTVVMTTHYLDEADLLCDRIAIIHQGQIRAIAPPAELKRQHGHTRTHLRVTQDAQHVANALTRTFPSSRIARCGDDIRVEAEDVARVITTAAATCRERGLAHPEVWTERPSLDEVFLAVSGDIEPDLDGSVAEAAS